MKNTQSVQEKFAYTLGGILAESLLIILGLFRIILKLLIRFRKWEWHFGIWVALFYFLFSSFTLFTEAPKTASAHNEPFIAPSPTPVLSVFEQHEQYISSKSHGDIVMRIWDNETGKGRNVHMNDKTDLAAYCRSIGKTNEFGFNPYGKQCFNSFEESVDTVNAWFDSCLQIRGLGACLLRYSGNSNAYIEKFLNQSN